MLTSVPFQHFLLPLQAAAKNAEIDAQPILEQKTIREIFSNLFEIYMLAKTILQRLEEAVSTLPVSMVPIVPSISQIFQSSGSLRASGSSLRRLVSAPALPVPQNVGQVLCPVMPFLKMYSLFVQNFDRAQAALDREEKSNEAWRTYLMAQRDKGIGKQLNLSAMLLCIIQRIPRYRLLLTVSPGHSFEGLLAILTAYQDLLRFTDVKDADYLPLKQALKTVEEGTTLPHNSRQD